MLKPLTFGVSLALALGLSTVSKAGLFDHGCTTCGIASEQGPAPTAQSVVASPQYDAGCGDSSCGGGCGLSLPSLGLKHKLGGLFKHKPKTYTYEYVLKKKRVWGHKNKGCDDCGTTYAPATYPSGQYASPQGVAPAPQATAAPQTTYSAGSIAPATLAGDVPPPPEISLTPAGN